MTETLESVQACLSAGADPNGASEDGRTTLDWAVEREDSGITAALIAAGADPAGCAAARRGRTRRWRRLRGRPGARRCRWALSLATARRARRWWWCLRAAS